MICVEKVLSVQILKERVEPAVSANSNSVVDLHYTVNFTRGRWATFKSLCNIYAINYA